MILSICIPTYNRRNELERLLTSIEVAKKATEVDLEVIVHDNASTDGTEELIHNAKKRLNYIKYYCNLKNEGFAANINKSVAASNGRYCWLMGSDDSITPDSIKKIINQVERNPSLIIGNPITHSIERKFFLFQGERNFNISSENDLTEYISHCNEISSAFAFMSTIIISRKFWNKVQCTEYELNHPYTHMLRIIRGLCTYGGDLQCINTPIVVTGHSGNEWNKTILPHFELDLLTIQHIIKSFLKSTPTALKSYSAVFRRQYSTTLLLKSRVESTEMRWNAIKPILQSFGYSNYLLEKTILDTLWFKIYLYIKNVRANKYSINKLLDRKI